MSNEVHSNEADPDPGSQDSVTSDLLLAYVRDRDVTCPQCGYNLRNLSSPVCPECRQDLKLTVGVEKVRYEWLIAILIPGAFSGICAFLLLLPMVIAPGPVPMEVVGLDAFGWLSAAVAMTIFVQRQRFLKLDASTQYLWVFFVWMFHVSAFAILVTAL